MSLSSQKETRDSYPPSSSSNRASIDEVHGISSTGRESIQSQQESISNYSVHSTTVSIHKDFFDLSGQGDQDPSSSNYKYLSFQKPTSGFRNQCLSVCTTCEPESNRSSTATSAPSLLSLEDEAETAETSPPSTPHPSRAIASTLITDPSPSPSPSPVYAVPPLPSLGDGDSQTLAAMEMSTADTPSTRPAHVLPRATDRMATFKPTPSAAEVHTVTRVRALHSFEPTEPNELAFEKGDIIKVVNREYEDWWGQLGGRTGKFPVDYVEPLPEPTLAELADEVQQEAAVFSQTANVDRLLTLTMLSTLDPAKDNLADNEEIQELYRSYMSLRPKIVNLIDEYSQKR
ncbi:hypothetical protein DFH94DRAFT_745414, partial [Russula ochroleuca]